MKVVWATVIVFCAAVSVEAQPLKASCNRACVRSVAVYVGGSAMDVASSVGRAEANRFLRGGDGRLDVGRAVALKAAVLGVTFIGQRRWPKLMAWCRIAVGALGAGVAVRNWQTGRGGQRR